MVTATLTRPRPRALPAAVLPRLAFAGLCVLAVVGFFAYPTYPNYDSYYSLLWGREALDLQNLSFVGYRHPTEHPLAILLAVPLSLLGEGADRVWVALSIASFLALVAGLYRLAALSFGVPVGVVAAVLLCTRFDFPFLAVRGYIDVPYLALVVWAAALELERPRRGTGVFVLLAAAALLRPEGWVLIGLYFLWCAWRASWRRRAVFAALTALGPVTWAVLDFAVTGDPLFSLNSTSGLAEELGRAKGLEAVPVSTRSFLIRLDKLPVVLAGVAGLGLALWFAPRRALMPLALFASGLGTFVAVGIAGLSVIERYLLVPSLMVMVLAGVAIGGFGMLREGTRARRVWTIGAAALVVFAAVFTATRVSFSRLDTELRFRGAAHADLRAVLRAPAVAGALKCGPVSVPTHKLVPDVRWIVDRDADGVLARADDATGRRADRGVAIVVTGRSALTRQVFVDSTVDPLVNLPPAGFRRASTTQHYAAYVRC